VIFEDLHDPGSGGQRSAGEAYKIVRRNKRTGIVGYELWYSPQVKQWVKIRENLDSGLRTRELISFDLL
jgi:hypothetical protein